MYCLLSFKFYEKVDSVVMKGSGDKIKYEIKGVLIKSNVCVLYK